MPPLLKPRKGPNSHARNAQKSQSHSTDLDLSYRLPTSLYAPLDKIACEPTFTGPLNVFPRTAAEAGSSVCSSSFAFSDYEYQEDGARVFADFFLYCLSGLGREVEL